MSRHFEKTQMINEMINIYITPFKEIIKIRHFSLSFTLFQYVLFSSIIYHVLL